MLGLAGFTPCRQLGRVAAAPDHGARLLGGPRAGGRTHRGPHIAVRDLPTPPRSTRRPLRTAALGHVSFALFAVATALCIGRPRLVALGLGSAAAADLIVAAVRTHLAAFATGILLLGLGFMFAHSSPLSTASQFAERARGASMSLIAYAFMIGGSLGTMPDRRILLGGSYCDLYLPFGIALGTLCVVAVAALPAR